MTIALQVEERTVQTGSGLRQLRKQGKVPGVVYGKKIDGAASISVEEKELLALLRSHPNAVMEIELSSAGKQPVMITEIQRDPLSNKLLHVDFRQINMNEEVKTSVRIDVVGESGGVKEGGIMQQLLHELEIQCLPDRIPESLSADISHLETGDNLLAKDIELPQGVMLKSDPELVVVSILMPQKDEAEEEADEAAEAEERAAIEEAGTTE